MLAKLLGKTAKSVGAISVERVTGLAVSQDISNPYLDARREWNERYGSYIARAATWQYVAIGSIALSGVLAFSLVHIAGQSKVQPFIVEVDKLGAAVAVGSAEKVQTPDERIIRYQVANFVTNVRSVTFDATVQKKWLDAAYAITTARAGESLNGYYKLHDPFEAAKNNTVEVEIKSALAVSDKTWEVQWKETKRSTNGTGIDDETRWKGIFGIGTYDNPTQAQIVTNPTSVTIDTMTWTQQL